MSILSYQSTFSNAGDNWLQAMVEQIERLDSYPYQAVTTTVTPCLIEGRQSLISDKNLPINHPLAFNYLEYFARYNDVVLMGEGRERVTPKDAERRRPWIPIIALGASMMLRSRRPDYAEIIPSNPHVLRCQERDIDAIEVLRLAARARAMGHTSTFNSNGLINPHNNSHDMVNCYEYFLGINGQSRVVNYFEGKSFYALGYLSGDQLCLQILVAGGADSAPKLWGAIQRMTRDPLQFHYLPGGNNQQGFGIFKSVYYLEYK